MSENRTVSIQSRLEEKAIKKLKNDLDNDIGEFLSKWNYGSIQNGPIKINAEGVDKMLYSLMGECVKDELFLRHKDQYIKNEVDSFMADIETTKQKLDELYY